MIGICRLARFLLQTLQGVYEPKVSSETRSSASGAQRAYLGHCGSYPPSGAEVPGGQCNGSGLSALTVAQTNATGQTLGPFLAAVPTPPFGWTAYTRGYVANANETYSLTTSGDGYVVTVP